jgi:arylsulfatase A-like enzyme
MGRDGQVLLRHDYSDDHSFGLIIDKLKESGMFDDTLVIYTSDHGDMCGSHRMIDKH